MIVKITATVAAAGLVLAFAPSAHADGQGQQALLDRYSTLSGALINAQAYSQNMTVGQYLSSMKATISTLPPAPGLKSSGVLAVSSLDVPGGQRLSASSLTDLNQQLSQSGAAFATDDYASLEALATAVVSKSAGADAQVTAAGAAWATSLGQLSAGTLTMPTVGEVAVPQYSAEALPFGLLINKSLTQMALQAPGMVASIGSSGLGGPKAQKQWAAAMNAAWAGSQQDLESTLPDQCTGGMMAVMATGNPGSAAGYGSCGTACVAGGLYLHNQAMSIFDPQVNSVIPNPVNGTLNAATVGNLPPALAQSIQTQTPAAGGSSLAALLSSNATGCSAASASTTGLMQSSLPGVWANLQN